VLISRDRSVQLRALKSGATKTTRGPDFGPLCLTDDRSHAARQPVRHSRDEKQARAWRIVRRAMDAETLRPWRRPEGLCGRWDREALRFLQSDLGKSALRETHEASEQAVVLSIDLHCASTRLLIALSPSQRRTNGTVATGRGAAPDGILATQSFAGLI